MSSLPASPNPQRSRGFAPVRRVRTALRSRTGTDAPPAEDDPAGSAGTAVAGTVPGTAVPGDAGAGTDPAAPVPAAPDPSPEATVRIPYRQWKGPRPRVVGMSFALIVLAGVISLAGGIAAARSPVAEPPPAVAQLEQLGIEVTGYAAVSQALALASALVVFGLYLLLAFMVREGRNWARIGGSLLAGPALVAGLVQGEMVHVFALLTAVGGLGLLYRSDCSRYFRPRQAQYRSAAS